MKARRTKWWLTMRRLLRSRYLPMTLLAIVLVALAIYLVPRPTREVVSVDGRHRWDENAAPPTRGIVWQPAEPVEATVPGTEAEDSLIRPQLADGGSVLYFTLQKGTGGADIYCSALRQGVWQPAGGKRFSINGWCAPASMAFLWCVDQVLERLQHGRELAFVAKLLLERARARCAHGTRCWGIAQQCVDRAGDAFRRSLVSRQPAVVLLHQMSQPGSV